MPEGSGRSPKPPTPRSPDPPRPVHAERDAQGHRSHQNRADERPSKCGEEDQIPVHRCPRVEARPGGTRVPRASIVPQSAKGPERSRRTLTPSVRGKPMASLDDLTSALPAHMPFFAERATPSRIAAQADRDVGKPSRPLGPSLESDNLRLRGIDSLKARRSPQSLGSARIAIRSATTSARSSTTTSSRRIKPTATTLNPEW